MRFHAITLALATLGSLPLLASASASGLTRSIASLNSALDARGTTPNPAHAFEKRQGARAVVCANVDVNLPRTTDGICALPALGTACSGVPGIAVRNTLLTVLGLLSAIPNPIVNLCLCVDATGQLTTQSVTNLRTALGLRITNLAGIDNLLQTILPNLDLTAIVGPAAASLVPQAGASCNYPANSEPICSATPCDFQCTVNPAFPQKCNGACIAAGANCATAGPTRRRRTLSNDLLCDGGRQACALPGRKFGFECIDTRSDVEACGGCAYPLPGALKGHDCTAIPHIGNVDCIRGQCVVTTCRRGFALVDNSCIEADARQISNGDTASPFRVATLFDEAALAVGIVKQMSTDNRLVQQAKKSIASRQVTAESLRARSRARRAQRSNKATE